MDRDKGADKAEDAPVKGKGQIRIERILAEIPGAREQMTVGIEDLGPTFDKQAIERAMRSGDPREKNKVAVIERELDVLISYVDELTKRSLAEGQRLGVATKGNVPAMDRLVEVGALAKGTADRLRSVKEMRNQLAHAYPPAAWRALCQAVETLLAELDHVVVGLARWLRENGIV
jgi:hypothetical protein